MASAKIIGLRGPLCCIVGVYAWILRRKCVSTLVRTLYGINTADALPGLYASGLYAPETSFASLPTSVTLPAGEAHRFAIVTKFTNLVKSP